MRHESVKIVTPDWIADSIRDKVRLDEERYHPKLLMIEPTPDPSPEPAPVTEPIQHVKEPPNLSIVLPTLPMDMGSSDPLVSGSTSPMSSSPPPYPPHTPPPITQPMAPSMIPTELPRTPKEKLARMVSNRIQASGRRVENGIEVPPPSGIMRPMMPGAPNTSPGSRPGSPRMLRNITNNAESPKSPARTGKVGLLKQDIC